MADNDLPLAPWEGGKSTTPPTSKATISGSSSDLPNAPWETESPSEPPEPADHGLSERQKLSPVQKAISPITSYPETYKRMRNEAGEQVSKGIGQMTHPDNLIDPEAHGLSDVLKGAANTAIGAAGYIASPVSAAYRSIIGQPLEDTTGIPREYSEFAAQLATPGIGLKTLAGKPKVPPVPKPAPPVPDPFGVTLSEGEETGSLPAIRKEQEARRDMLGPTATKQAGAFDTQREQQLDAANESVTRQLDPTGNQVLASTPHDAAELAQTSLQREASRTKQDVTDAYGRAKQFGGELHPDVIKDMPVGIREDLSNATEPVYVDQNTPVAANMLRYLDESAGKLNIRNDASLSSPVPGAVSGVSLEGVDQIRKGLSTLRGDALKASGTNPSDARAANAVMRAFDDRINTAVNSAAPSGANTIQLPGASSQRASFIGDPRAVQAWNDARALASQRFKTYGNDAVGKKIQAIIGDARLDKDPASLQAVSNYIYGGTGTAPTELNIAVAKRIQKILGADSPEWAAIRQGYFKKLVENTAGKNDKGYGRIADNLAEALDGRGRGLSEALFTPAQRDMLREYGNLHRKLQVPPTGANWSETATFTNRALRAVSEKISGLIGAVIGHTIAPGLHGAGEYVGAQIAGKSSSLIENAKNARQIQAQMPLVAQQIKRWQQAVKQQQRAASIANQTRVSIAATNVASALGKMGVDQGQALRVLAGPQGPGTGEAKERAEGGAVNDDYNTFLTPEQETGFQTWKSQIAPDDSGVDYDLRGAYLANMQKADNGHMGDQFKKPNHPTFSDQSQYATGDQADRAGFWNGDTFVPPVATKADGGEVSDDQSDKEQAIGIHPVNPDQPPLPEVPALSPALEKTTTEGSFSSGTKIGNKLAGTGGEERYQTWPERMIRSGATLAGDVMSGEQPMLPPGLRREDYTDKPKPEGLTVAAQPNDPTYERVQDMAGLAGTGGLGGSEAGAVLNSTPSLRPALKYNGKIYKAPVGGQHLDAIPPEVYPEFQKQAMSGEDISNFNFGFMNHKGQFLDRDAAMDYAVKEGLIDPHAANQGALTSTILEDSSVAGAPVAALEHAQPFYSAVQKTVETAPQQKMQGVQWANWLKNQPGVKPDEMQYTGLDNWLREQKGPVTKQQVQDFVEQNQVKVNDVTKGGKPALTEDEAYEQARWEIEDEHQGIDTASDHFNDEVSYRAQQLMEDGPQQGTKYQSYQLPGGENYREHLITLPEKGTSPQDIMAAQNKSIEARNDLVQAITQEAGVDGPNIANHLINNPSLLMELPNYARNIEPLVDRFHEAMEDFLKLNDKRAKSGDSYKSSHWDEPNILAHVRTNDRDVGGKPALHIEELQSDWHQAGRKKGYAEDPSNFPKVRNWVDFMKDKGFSREEALQKWNERFKPEDVTLHNEHLAESESRAKAIAKAQAGVPNAPFKTSWPELVMKRMIQKAAAEGKDRISWTPGEAQAARYDLSRQIKSIRVMKNNDGTFRLVGEHDRAGGYHDFGKEIPRDKLPDYVGKDLADKINKDFSKANPYGPSDKTYSGTDLKVGGEGMKGFYDQMLPKMVEKLGKPYGVKVKQSGIEKSYQQPIYEGLEPTKEQIAQVAEAVSAKPTDQRFISPVTGQRQMFQINRAASQQTFNEVRQAMNGGTSFAEAMGRYGNHDLAEVFGGAIKTKTAKENQPVHYFDIPPKMKEDVLSKGFPLFSDTSHGAALSALEHGEGFETYHGSPYKFGKRKDAPYGKFDYKHFGEGAGADVEKHGFFFGKKPETAEIYGEYGHIYKVNLRGDPNKNYLDMNTKLSQMHPELRQNIKNIKNEGLERLLKEKEDPDGDEIYHAITDYHEDNSKELRIHDQINVLEQAGIYGTRGPEHGDMIYHVLDPDNAKIIDRKSYGKHGSFYARFLGGRVNTNTDKKQIERPVKKAKTEPEINAPVNRAAGGRVLASNIASPSPAQAEAGNYKKDHIHIYGLSIAIENAKGSIRKGVGVNGPWKSTLPSHYGYIKKTVGADEDHLDVYIGPHIKSQKVYVVNQVDANTKKFDEVKIILGMGSLHQALNCYKKAFSDGRGVERIGSIVATDVLHLRKWLNSANTRLPFTIK